ncbi:MAG: alpha/beta hydrolase [Leptospiraceae bacterium]|nr:alpha/beta hydrolase [Leptospiraceae bacterium]
MFQLALFLLALNLFAWFVAKRWLSGEDLTRFDQPTGDRFSHGDQASAEIGAVVASFSRMKSVLKEVPLRQRTKALREHMDKLFAERDFSAFSFIPVERDGVVGEWVLAPGCDGSRRTLYIHGGAFTMGSPRSHRTVTTRFAEITGGAVLALDYRLMPEHKRRAGIEDCRIAYQWVLEHGPEGPVRAQTVVVAGDSAGGNLTLSLVAWMRDTGLRAPDAAVALSPLTDATLVSPSFKGHVKTDALLGPLFGAMAKVPRYLLLWIGLIQTRINPRNPLVSPVYGDLSGLPPILVQVGEQEMLRDDARRYVNRAQAAGSPVRLQTWDHVMHVWHIFNPELTEARQALDEIDRFLTSVCAPVQLPPPRSA